MGTCSPVLPGSLVTGMPADIKDRAIFTTLRSECSRFIVISRVCLCVCLSVCQHDNSRYRHEIFRASSYMVERADKFENGCIVRGAWVVS